MWGCFKACLGLGLGLICIVLGTCALMVKDQSASRFFWIALGVTLSLGVILCIAEMRPAPKPRTDVLGRHACDICGNALNRMGFTWNVQGQKKVVCTHCNQSLASERSKAALSAMNQPTGPA